MKCGDVFEEVRLIEVNLSKGETECSIPMTLLGFVEKCGGNNRGMIAVGVV